MSVFQLAAASFLALLPITNPLGAIAVFAGLTANADRARINKMAVRTGAYVAAILVVFALLGSLLLTALGITIPALQIAGGLVVAHSGFQMLGAKTQLTDAEHGHAQTLQDISFSPMALPMIAGPGAIGVVIALASRHGGLTSSLGIAAGGLAIGVVVGLCLRFGTGLITKLGPTGVGALSRIMGFLILAIGAELMIHGVLAVWPTGS